MFYDLGVEFRCLAHDDGTLTQFLNEHSFAKNRLWTDQNSQNDHSSQFLLISTSMDQLIKWWRVEWCAADCSVSATLIQASTVNLTDVSCMALSADGGMVAVGGDGLQLFSFEQ